VDPPFETEIDLSTVADFTPDPWWWFADGVGVDFTGCTAELALRVSPTDLAPLLVISTTATSSGLIVLGTLAGENLGLVLVAINHSALAGVVYPVAHGELLITMSDGSVVEFLRVTARIRQGSTY
jgi:hypothetical protein